MKFLCILILVLLPLSSEIGEQAASDAAIFEKVLPGLRTKTRVPIKLPHISQLKTKRTPFTRLLRRRPPGAIC